MSDEPGNRLDISDEMIAERRQVVRVKCPSDMPPVDGKFNCNTIDKSSKWIGNVVCWITDAINVLRWFMKFSRENYFYAPTMWAYDMSRFFYGALFMLGAGYALI